MIQIDEKDALKIKLTLQLLIKLAREDNDAFYRCVTVQGVFPDPNDHALWATALDVINSGEDAVQLVNGWLS